MARSPVYMIPIEAQSTTDRLAFSLEAVMGHRSFNLVNTFLDGDLVGIKLPYTEDKAHNPSQVELLAALVNSLKKRRRVVFICDTAARHVNKKANAIEHMELMMGRGITFEGTGAPFAMLDGINGGYEMTADLGRRRGGKVFLAGELQNMNGMVVTAYPKPIGENCYEGALFNMGVGLGAKRGKIQLYSTSGPQVNVEKCYLCKKCIYICPVGAIHKGDRHVVIDHDRCINCGKCVDLTRFGGISYHWDSTREEFTERLIRIAKGAHKVLSGKLVYVNILMAGPHESPCQEQRKDPNLAILVSRDPVALDQATLELFRSRGLVPEVSAEEDRFLGLAEELELGTRAHRLITVAY